MMRKGGKDAKSTESVWAKIVSGKEAKCCIFKKKKKIYPCCMEKCSFCMVCIAGVLGNLSSRHIMVNNFKRHWCASSPNSKQNLRQISHFMKSCPSVLLLQWVN